MSDPFFSFVVEHSVGFPMLMCQLTHRPVNDEEAWAMTLEKWKVLSAIHDERIHDGGTSTCGLCHIYHGCHRPGGPMCEFCPIAVADHPECHGTPYREYVDAEDVDDAHGCAKRELYFLKQVKKGAEVKDD